MSIGDGYGSGDGDGDGYGSGSGDGDGDGDGSGSGSGSGYGSGDGDGDGYGSGSGSGDGYGDGYGSGSGSGDGDGYGYGYGYGSGFTDLELASIAARSGFKAEGVLAFWKSDASGRPCNGGSGEPVSKGLRQTLPGPLRLCEAGTFHATRKPNAWKGDRLWLVDMQGEIVLDGDKCGALVRVILGEIVQ